ncbi:NRDE family protein [Spirosoma terrae]|uniref:NRDE family protein n=1 Tax=Spirosoma terrae TaxID=1968276 RepID=A0A6L9LDZ4_9BACT|nr:NRDE family protein [Spirosoma terrae]NDU98774.1 hypothetical protein [Spirosoma terrae]
MCTVTYLPQPRAGFLLTSSRDEKTIRPAAIFPVRYQSSYHKICYPKDPQSAGSWVAASSQLTVCLLNGAFRAHAPRAPYRHSRGLVVLSVFDYPSPADWFAAYNFIGLEPFTLIIIEPEATCQRFTHPVERLWEVRWDGQTPHLRQLNPQLPHIWSSVTLYSDEVIARRQQWFGDWLVQQPTDGFKVSAIRDFHKQAGAGDTVNGVLMNRGNGMQTISLTTIHQEGENAMMCYEDLLTNTIRHQQLSTTNEHVFAH